MNKKFTLIYLLNSEENDKGEMINAEDLGDDGFKNFEDVFKVLNSVKSSPSQAVVDNIIQFANTYELIDLGSKGNIEMILN